MHPDPTQELLEIRRRYLHHLKRQETTQGIHTPAHILLDIEQTSEEIRQLTMQAHRYIFHDVLETERPQRMPGLIALINPEHPDQHATDQAAFAAIDYHRTALRHCWLIASIGDHGSLGAAQKLRTYCEQRHITTEIWQIHDPLNAQETYNLVEWIYTQSVPAKNLNEQQTIADITGATKPMSIGMLLACGNRRPVQYMAHQAHAPSLPLLLRIIPNASSNAPIISGL